jgi:hypothetical protein
MQSLGKSENHGRASAFNHYFHSFMRPPKTFELLTAMAAGIAVKALRDV